MATKVAMSDVCKALEKTHGLVSPAARLLGVTEGAVRKYILKYPAVREARDNARERTLDLSEERLIQAIDNGDPWAIQFYLKTIGRNRGYTERMELGGPDGGPLQIVLEVIDSREQVSERLSE